jgi:hypothetical protein
MKYTNVIFHRHLSDMREPAVTLTVGVGMFSAQSSAGKGWYPHRRRASQEDPHVDARMPSR